MLSGVMNSGLIGVSQGIQGMQQAASQIAAGGQPVAAPEPAATVAQPTAQISSSQGVQGDIVEPIVDMKLYEVTTEASAKVIKAADNMIGTLLDITA